MIHKIKKLFGKIDVDGAIAFTVLTRVIQAGSGLISIVFIARYLSNTEQGYYYTFASILAIQIFFELGLSGILTQYAAHEYAHLEWKENSILEGDDYYKSRLSSLLRFCVKWFGIISIALFFILCAAGFYFFHHYNKTDTVNWETPWIILCFATSLNLFIDPLLAFFDGLGRVKDMAKVRLIQKIVYLVLLCVGFALGFKLYASAIASLIAIGVNYVQVVFSDRIKLLKTIWIAKGEHVIDYFKEIFPFQWRIAVSWISGYFIFQLFNPVLFAIDGPVVAGQMGITLAALNGVLSVSLSWINTKVPVLSGMVAKKQYDALDRTFNAVVKQTNIVTVGLLAIFLGAVMILKYYNFTLGHRFLAPLPLILLCVATFINQYVYALATYLRCHKQEPFLVQSIVMGILSAVSTLCLGNLFGVNGITIGYVSLLVFVSLTWVIVIFKTKKREWHI